MCVRWEALSPVAMPPPARFSFESGPYASCSMDASKPEDVSKPEGFESGPDSAPRLPSLPDRLRTRYGPDIDPGIALSDSQAGGEATEEITDEVLDRLGARQANFGRYRIKGELARGGQGVVLRVWDEDLHRNLAMKVILGQGDPARGRGGTPDIPSRVVGRFLEEAQVTGQLDHPGIVPVHELGVDDDGRVYFTMKLVRGRELGEILDLVRAGREGWTQTRALGVFLKVCEAMAYAHSKKVIHRDLKPSNVMVGRYGEVYLMDWGLARVMDGSGLSDTAAADTNRTVIQTLRDEENESGSPILTLDGTVIGTPNYMSPEQAAGDFAAMGPHSDVYAVGAMLYQLLTGQVPYHRPGEGTPNARAVLAMLLMGPPSSIRSLAPETPPELEAICERAMERRFPDRYRDMGELAEDLRAYLEHRVVRAYRTGALVEFKKWVGRNRGMAAASVAAVTLAFAGLGSTAYVEAKGSERVAEKNAELEQANEDLSLARGQAEESAERAKSEAERARVEAERAQEESAINERVVGFMLEMFEASSLESARGEDVTVKQALDGAVAKLSDGLSEDPGIRGQLLTTMGRVYYSLGLSSEALPVVEQAIEVTREHLGPTHERALFAASLLGGIHLQEGRYAEAEQVFKELLEASREARGEDDLETLAVLNNLANTYLFQGRFAEALPILEDLVAIYPREGEGVQPQEILPIMNNLAFAYQFQGRLEEAEALLFELFEENRSIMGEEHPQTLQLMGNLGWFLIEQKRYEEAEPLMVESAEKLTTIAGPSHPITLVVRDNLGLLRFYQGEIEESRDIFRGTLAARRALEPVNIPETMRTAQNLARTLHRLGEYEESEALYLEAIAGFRESLPPEHPQLVSILEALAQLYIDLERFADAEPLALELLELAPPDSEEHAAREEFLRQARGDV